MTYLSGIRPEERGDVLFLARVVEDAGRMDPIEAEIVRIQIEMLAVGSTDLPSCGETDAPELRGGQRALP